MTDKRTNPTTRQFLRHRSATHTYAVEVDEQGTILQALDVTEETAKGGLCPHMLPTLPLAASLDDVEMLEKTRDEWDVFTPDCVNVHHLMADLIALERDHRRLIDRYAMEDATSKSTKREMEAAGAKVHALLSRVADRQKAPLPLFAAL